MKNRPAHSFVQLATRIARPAVLMVLVSLTSCVTHGTIVVNEESLAPATLIIGWAESGALYVDNEPFGELVAGEPREIQIRKDGEVAVKIVGETYTWVRAVTVSSGRSVEVDHFERDGSIVIRNEIFIEGGTFQMGTRKGGEDNERPVHSVTVGSFFMAQTETTFDQYDAFARATYRELPDDHGLVRGTRPVIHVSWYDAVAFANWLSGQDGLTPAYTVSGTNVTWNRNANGWRLPTEAEWEFAARGGTQGRDYTYAGGNDVGTVAWYNSNSSSRTQPVGGKQANELGLHDMSGNVWEWVWDWYGTYPSGAQTDPAGPSSGGSRVLRGGGWSHDASYARSALRSYISPDARYGNYGFRLARSAVR